jgi:F-type H+-transporting ATPase subunit delta
VVVDPELIGGVKVEVGDQVLDLSVQAELQKLYAAMTN